jgi:hypothetical protein
LTFSAGSGVIPAAQASEIKAKNALRDIGLV